MVHSADDTAQKVCAYLKRELKKGNDFPKSQ